MSGMICGIVAVVVILLLVKMMTGSPVPTISAPDVQALVAAGGCLLLDVRTAGEWRGSRIAGATHIPLADLGVRSGELPAGRPIVVYCASGVRSRAAAGTLLQKGFNDVRNMAGGIAAWQRSGLPVER